MKAIIVVESFEAEYEGCGSHQIRLTLDIDERELHSFIVDRLRRDCAICDLAPAEHEVGVVRPESDVSQRGSHHQDTCTGYEPTVEPADG